MYEWFQDAKGELLKVEAVTAATRAVAATAGIKTITTPHTLLGLPLYAEYSNQSAATFYVDQNGLCVVGDIAYLISGYTGDSSFGGFLPYIYRFNLTSKTWLSPVKIPSPPWATPLVPGTQYWDHQGTDQTRIFTQWSYTGTPTCPALPVLTGWSFQWSYNTDFTVTSAYITAGATLNAGPADITLHATPTSSAVALALPPLVSPALVAGVPTIPTLAGFTAITVVPAVYSFGAGGLGFEGGVYGVIDTKLYFGCGDGNLAGHDGNVGGKGIWLASYDTVTGQFDWTLPNRPEGLDYGFYAVADNKLWTWASSPYQPVYSFNPASKTWTAHGTPTTDDNPHGSDLSNGIQVDRRIIWADQGLAYHLDDDTWQHVYDPITNAGGYAMDSWCVLAPDGTIWVSGAHRDSSDPTNASKIGTRIFDPSTDTWRDPTDQEHAIKAPKNSTANDVLPAEGTSTVGLYVPWCFATDGSYVWFAGNAVLVPHVVTHPYLHDTNAGFVMTSPDGTKYNVSVANGGTLSITAV